MKYAILVLFNLGKSKLLFSPTDASLSKRYFNFFQPKLKINVERLHLKWSKIISAKRKAISKRKFKAKFYKNEKMLNQNSTVNISRMESGLPQLATSETSIQLRELPATPTSPTRPRASSPAGIALRRHHDQQRARAEQRRQFGQQQQQPPIFTFANWTSIEMTDEERQYFNRRAEYIRQSFAPSRLATIHDQQERLDVINEYAENCAILTRDLGNLNRSRQRNNLSRSQDSSLVRPQHQLPVRQEEHEPWTRPVVAAVRNRGTNAVQTWLNNSTFYNPIYQRPETPPPTYESINQQQNNRSIEPTRRRQRRCCIL